MPSLNPTKSGQVLTGYHLLSLGWGHMLRFLCFLPVSQSWAGFLCMLHSYLQKLTLTALRGMHRELAIWMGYGWGTWSIGGACGPLEEICMWDVPSDSWMSSLIKSVKWLENQHSLIFGCCSSFSLPLSHISKLSILHGERKKFVCLFVLALSHTARETRCSFTCSHFPCRRNHRLRGSLLALNCATMPPWKRSDSSKMKLFFLSSSMGPISEVFAPTVCPNFAGFWISTKAALSVGDCQNLCNLGGRWYKTVILLFLSLLMACFFIQVRLHWCVQFVKILHVYTYDLCTFHHYLTVE